ncbi:MAG: tRNA (adenosine(37)-N6)-threonylcarbamoyltransferase complex transferase subunit TsaD [Clostridia bacterium]|nr:tRNA (adenosine(37)-N6)-threonylcarbamoyltransferase complex transferase subunit TsaD [Clostridia bacterium]
MKILAFETSCDETAAAVVEDGRRILSDAVLSQIETHARFGGVVPEIASRAHTEAITVVCDRALAEAGIGLEDVDAVAVTARPGLIGALLVGVNFAKSLALAAKKPLIPVNHIEGHIAAAYPVHPDLEPPFLAMVMSGGHTSIVEVRDYTDFRLIGATRDDAAGEAFDKAARVLGIPYPGGKEMDRLAALGDPKAIAFPPAVIRESRYDLSFSGLKTAVINYAHHCEQTGEAIPREDLAASFTAAVCRGVTSRLENAIADRSPRDLVLAGGVSANSHVRAAVEALCGKRGVRLRLLPLSLCGDNGAMIGAQAYYDFLAGKTAGPELNAEATSPFSFHA